ncbi:MAG: hypothetical protein NDP13_04900 [Crenarchaeota archaeon]|nr:hypothetical protein [Thermoproteota archaeon]MCR8454305.1 hypothetical protein [Thermoproteota archaeon]MCR8455073.1 hypothetical protein [Thermoproteota archaeon]MCR8463366.1 hypothetical protein [Thermoproteota archaeon]MCR8470813.1 hypothetical protein [Thermoproteota archaeon]
MPGEKFWGTTFILVAILISCVWTVGLIGLVAAWFYKISLEELLFSGTKIWIIQVPPLIWLLYLPIWVAVVLVGLILGWVGVSLIKTPPLEEVNVEELEKEIEKEAEKLKSEEQKTSGS